MPAQYKRIGKGGKEVWIQASYNPIIDVNGKPFKVVKYATDITAQVKASRGAQTAVQQSQDVIGQRKNDLTQRIPLEGKTGEIGELCGGVNGLLDTIADSDQRDQVGLARSDQRLGGNLGTPRPICRSAPRSRPRAWKRPRRRWRRSRRR